MQPATRGARSWCLGIALLCVTPLSCAQTTLQTPQQTNDRIKALSSAARLASRDYIIGNGDVLTIEVFDIKEFSREVRVSQTGSIGLPLVPTRLHMAGLTEAQAERKIAEVLESNGLVTHPEVRVFVKERKSKPITVVGAVPRPMVYQADRPITLLEILAEAGGVSNGASDTVIVRRPGPPAGHDPADSPVSSSDIPLSSSAETAPPSVGSSSSAGSAAPSDDSNHKAIFPSPAAGEAISAPPDAAMPPALSNTITVNLYELMESGDASNNIVLQAGDIVTVPHAGIVYVLGAVGRPGGFVLSNDRSPMSTLKILSLAGGLKSTAKSSRAVIVRRNNQGQQHEVVVDLKKVMDRKTEDVALQASDILYIPDSNAKKALFRAAEIGLGIGTGVALYRIAYR